MRFLYKHFYIIALVLLTMFSVAVLSACSDTTSQSTTGGGSNFKAGEDIKSSGNVNQPPASDGDSGGSVDGQDGGGGNASCANIPEALPGCSYQSYLDCVCYDPNNPDQNGSGG